MVFALALSLVVAPSQTPAPPLTINLQDLLLAPGNTGVRFRARKSRGASGPGGSGTGARRHAAFPQRV